MAERVNEIKPQPGFQTEFLSSHADIVIGGGAAGAGKTFAELLEPLRNFKVQGFGAVFFRRTVPQIKSIGGLLDESKNIYYKFGAKLNQSSLSWQFPSGALVKFRSLEHEKNIYDHQGAQYPLIIFDELTHFSKKQFLYLLSRNRSTCGVPPYVRATCNPDPDSWVAEFISWWIDQETGFPIHERAGKVRYFVAEKDNYIWGNTREEVIEKAPYLFDNPAFADLDKSRLVKSLTFIPGTIYQNQKLLEKDPGYLANLLSQDETERARLLEGNWKISTDGLSLIEFSATFNLFSNFVDKNDARVITCDAARFGANLAIIMVWKGYEVVAIHVFTKSALDKLRDTIEHERERWNIPKSGVLVDQDGLGGGLVDFGRYQGFSGGETAMEDPKTGIKENYFNKKTQLFYKLAEKVNACRMLVNIEQDSCFVDGVATTKVKIKGTTHELPDLIRKHLRCIKKKITDGDGKLRINSKEEQKAILGNDESPDFADTMMMRMQFDYKPAVVNADLSGLFF